MNRAAVVIAVKKAGMLPELKAALEGARQFEAWARREKFNTVETITDEDIPVTATMIKKKMKMLVDSNNVEQLFIYFAGHGVNLHYAEYWLLSDAPEDVQEAVNVAGSAQLAKRCGIPHVIFISDACRTAPEGIQAQAIRGSEIFPNQLRGGPQKAVDVFYASLLGEPALEIQDKSASVRSYTSIFTTELMAALYGKRKGILSTAADKTKLFLRPQPLKRHLISEVPKLVAATLGATSQYSQTPDAEILSDEFAFVHVFDVGSSGMNLPPSDPAPLPKGGVRRRRVRGVAGPRTETPTTLIQDVLRATSGVAGEGILTAVRRSGTKADLQALEREVVPFGTAHFETSCGFKVRGACIATACAAGETIVEALDGELVRVHPGGWAARSVLIELVDGRAVLLPAIRDFIGGLTFENGNLINVSYEPSDNTTRWQDYVKQRAELAALRGLIASSVHRGVFRLERGDAPKLTERIRMFKGLDPTLALYAAYSYHRLGNSQLIGEMEDYLVNDVGVTFFDIAMLADREPNNHPRAKSVPFLPMLAQGWSLLGAFDADTPLLRELRPHVSSRSLWTVFGGAGVGMLRTKLEGSL